eukprot:SAG31_NODE_3565_length_4119_cov_108.823383_2_plen_177_part_00
MRPPHATKYKRRIPKAFTDYTTNDLLKAHLFMFRRPDQFLQLKLGQLLPSPKELMVQEQKVTIAPSTAKLPLRWRSHCDNVLGVLDDFSSFSPPLCALHLDEHLRDFLGFLMLKQIGDDSIISWHTCRKVVLANHFSVHNRPQQRVSKSKNWKILCSSCKLFIVNRLHVLLWADSD